MLLEASGQAIWLQDHIKDEWDFSGILLSNSRNQIKQFYIPHKREVFSRAHTHTGDGIE